VIAPVKLQKCVFVKARFLLSTPTPMHQGEKSENEGDFPKKQRNQSQLTAFR
jgi:hypothetical protein